MSTKTILTPKNAKQNYNGQEIWSYTEESWNISSTSCLQKALLQNNLGADTIPSFQNPFSIVKIMCIYNPYFAT